MPLLGCDDLQKRIKAGESVDFEMKSKMLVEGFPARKPGDDTKEKIAASICSLANRRGGYLVLGVNNKGKIESGELPDPDELGKWFANLNRDRCSPEVRILTGPLSCDGTDLFVVHVERRRGVPHQARAETASPSESPRRW